MDASESRRFHAELTCCTSLLRPVARAPLMDVSAYKTKTKVVEGRSYQVMPNVQREKAGWRVSIERVGEPRTRKFFADSLHVSTQSALDAAHVWLTSKVVRKPYEGIDLTREPARKMQLRRHEHLEGEKRLHRYELRIPASRSAWQRPWMSLYVGNIGSLSQERLRHAIAVLHGRWFEFRRRSLEVGIEAALELDYTEVAPAPRAAYDTTLMVSDVLAWNGKGKGVSYSPNPSTAAPVDPKRARAVRRKYRETEQLPRLGWETLQQRGTLETAAFVDADAAPDRFFVATPPAAAQVGSKAIVEREVQSTTRKVSPAAAPRSVRARTPPRT